MLDKDLADLYQVKSRPLRQQVKRNIERFPKSFMFKLNKTEVQFLVSQNVIPSVQSLGGHLPFAFTEHGVAMLSSILRSKTAIRVNIEIIKAFVKLRESLIENKEILSKLELLEVRVGKHDEDIKTIFSAIKKMLALPSKENRRVGFDVK